MRPLNLFLKRAFDLVGGIIIFIILSPILLIGIALIKVKMPGPIFFRQERVTKNGKVFNILKLRTMKVDREAESNFDSTKDEERITPLGRVLRRLKIDETPQLINVIKGDMSFVGPRPTIMKQVELYSNRQRQRLKMRAGMTGLAQVNGNVSLSWEQRIEYDIEYVTHFSIWMDIKILFKTIGVIIHGVEKYNKEINDGEKLSGPF